MLAMLLALLETTAQPPLPRQWAQFSRAGALNHVTETVDIATGERGDSATFRYRLRFTRQASNAAPKITYADSMSCPAVLAMIESMPSIRMPSPSPYGLKSRSDSIILDGARYALTAPSSDAMGNLSISSNIGSPLAAWVDASFDQLAPCWTAAAS